MDDPSGRAGMTAQVKTTRTRLADGRQLIYYDEGPAGDKPADTRPLPPFSAEPELRYDPLHGEWVTVTAHRNDRTFLPDAAECPLCPSRDGRRSEVPAADYDVVVFENRFPSFAPWAGELPPVDGLGLYPRRPGAGHCEVVCFSSDHQGSLSRVPVRRMRTVIEAWADRTRELTADPEVRQVFCFENRGPEIGVTLQHPHGQIYAYPFVPARTEQVLRACAGHDGDLFADILAAEREAGTRVVLEGRHWTAFVPAAARWPVEVHLYPHRHVPDLAALDEAELAELAEVYLELLARCDAYYDMPLPYVAGWHQAPAGARDRYRLHLELFSVRRAPDKLKYLAGSESGMAAWINDVPPERVAERLRA